MSSTRLTPRQVLTPGIELRWDPIVIDLTTTDLMVELDPALVLPTDK